MRLIILICSFLFAINSYAKNFRKSDLFNFPKGYTPEEVGIRLSERFLESPHLLHGGKWIHYAEVCALYGALRFSVSVNNQELVKKLQNRFEYLCSKESNLLPVMNHVDLNMFGCLPLEFYKISGTQSYFDLGIPYANTQWDIPESLKSEEKAWFNKNYSWQTRLWIDDMFMITIIQSQAFRATGDRKYIDRAAREMVMYLDQLQRPNGLFFHAPDVPFYWSRGNGWMAAGMTELLSSLPEDNTYRPRILADFQNMMKSLKKYQSKNGMWNQLIDEKDCWAETSGTAMFTYAMITGIKNGWLGINEYGPVVNKAWVALVGYINDKGDVTEVCAGTNKKDDKQYYYDRPRITGDFHGQAPVLWCVNALINFNSEGK